MSWLSPYLSLDIHGFSCYVSCSVEIYCILKFYGDTIMIFTEIIFPVNLIMFFFLYYPYVFVYFLSCRASFRIQNNYEENYLEETLNNIFYKILFSLIDCIFSEMMHVISVILCHMTCRYNCINVILYLRVNNLTSQK